MKRALLPASAFLAVVPAVGLCQAAESVVADGATPSDSDSVPWCELHIWPSSGLRSVYHGWFHGGIVDGAVSGRDGYPAIPEDPIDTALQVQLLADSALPAQLKLPTYKVIVHEAALDSRTIRTTSTRLAPSSSSCYAELVADDVFYQEDIVNGSYLKILFRFRAFGEALSPTRSFGTWAQTKLTHFPPKTPTENAAALAELQAAYKANISLFASYLNKPAGKKGK